MFLGWFMLFICLIKRWCRFAGLIRSHDLLWKLFKFSLQNYIDFSEMFSSPTLKHMLKGHPLMMSNTLLKRWFSFSWRSVTLCDIMWHYVKFWNILWNFETLSEIVWHFVTFCDILWHSVTFCDIVWHCVILCDILWHYVILCDDTLSLVVISHSCMRLPEWDAFWRRLLWL